MSRAIYFGLKRCRGLILLALITGVCLMSSCAPPPEGDGELRAQSLFVRLTAENFEAQTADEQRLVVMIIESKKCDACKMLKETMTALSDKYQNQFKFCIFEKDEEQELKMKFDVHDFPTIIVLDRDREVARWRGVLSQEALSYRLDKLVRTLR